MNKAEQILDLTMELQFATNCLRNSKNLSFEVQEIIEEEIRRIKSQLKGLKTRG